MVWNFGNDLFSSLFSNCCHKKMLLESLTIPLILVHCLVNLSKNHDFGLKWRKIIPKHATQILTTLHFWPSTICCLLFHSILVTKSCGTAWKQQFYPILHIFDYFGPLYPKCGTQILATSYFWLNTICIPYAL